MNYSKEEIGAILRGLRLNSGMTQKEVAEKLKRRQQIVGHWETGYSQPDANTLFILCALYGVSVDEAFGFGSKGYASDTLTPAGQRIGHLYDKADDRAKEIVEFTLKPFDDGKPIKKAPSREDAEIAEEIAPSVIALRHYTETAAAGLGDYLASEDFEMVEYPEDIVPYGADYTVKISGDSMEPNIHDGDIAFVKECVEIPDGKIGIFIIDGHSYCKELHIDEDEGRIYLVSHNEKYADKAIDPEFMDFRTVGRVLSTVTPE